VVERIADMPPNTIGFRSKGELTDDDFRTDLAPALHEAVAAGNVRLLLIVPPNFGPADVKRLAAQAQNHLEPGLGHRTDWKRIAILTDSGLLRRSSRLLAPLIPVETKFFKPTEEPQAKHWLLDP
jgi:hypothetical protein